MPKEFGLIRAIFYYLSFRRDAGRLEYFICTSISFTVLMLAAYEIYDNIYRALYGGGLGGELITPVHFPLFLYLLIMAVSVIVRRLRYLSFSIWWVLLLVLGFILPVYFWIIFPMGLLFFSKENEPIFSISTHAASSPEK